MLEGVCGVARRGRGRVRVEERGVNEGVWAGGWAVGWNVQWLSVCAVGGVWLGSVGVGAGRAGRRTATEP